MNVKSTGWTSLGVARSSHHHGSHRDLLSTPDLVPIDRSGVDAIVVPTARHPLSMLPAIRLASELDCQLVALCSKWSSASHVRKLAAPSGVRPIAIDIERFPWQVLPRLTTTELLVGTLFERKTDLSLKRNIGLLLAHFSGWQRIIFLDDDITIPEPADLRAATGLLDSYSGVGLTIGGFPDNSVVCHAYREVGGMQDTFIGGGALAVRTDVVDSFFPNIYNEDWFFLLDDARLRPSAITGTAVQQPYDPFADDRRARSEELGDCLAEGVFALLDVDKKVQDADTFYWARFLEERLKFIAEVIDKVQVADLDPAEKRRMITALKAARGRSQCIKPELCVSYLQAWQDDRVRWVKDVKARRAELAGLFGELTGRRVSRAPRPAA